MDTVFETLRILFKDAPVASMISWGLIIYAAYRFLRSTYNVAFNQAPWAKKMQMSASMVKRADFTIMINTIFLLYVAATALLGAPAQSYLLDAFVQIAFALWLATLLDWNWSDQTINGGASGPAPARRRYLLRLYRKRGLTIAGLVPIPVGLAAKYFPLTMSDWAAMGQEFANLLPRL